MNTNILNKRAQLVASASTAIMATAMLAAPSQAQSIVTEANLESTVQAHIVGGDLLPQTNSDNVDATAPSLEASITNEGAATGNFENNDNDADANAFGNRDGVGASLATIGSSAALPDDGIALTASSLNNAGAITASSTDAEIGITGSDITTGSVDVSSNSATASVTINEGSGDYEMVINGSEPVGYTNLATANASVTTDLSGSAGDLANLSGTLLVSSAQVASSTSDSTATVSGNDVFADLDRTLTGDITGTVTVDGNRLAADFTGNTRDASIGLAADDASTSVTAAISNAQRLDANNAAHSAYTVGNTVLGNVYSDVGTETTSFLDSSLSVAGNEASATSTGNTADTSITLADALAYDTAAANDGTATIDGLDATAVKLADVQASGALTGVNTQLLEDGTLTSRLDANTIRASVQSVESSSIDVSDSRMIASALGNDLTASIASGDGSAVFDASAVLASRQEINTATVRAQSLDNTVDANFGYGDDATFVDSSVTLDGNVQAASATGNKARQSISLAATDLNSGDSAEALLTNDLAPAASDETAFADGAIVVASVMANVDGDVSATQTNANISINAGDSLNESATNTSTAITDSVQQAFAVGSDAGNSIALNGVDVGTGAGISNVQTNDATSTVSATQSATVDTYYDWNLVSGSADISGNAQSAIARGAVAANTIMLDAQTVDSNSTATVPAATSVVDLTNTAEAAYGIANTQQVLADVTAESTPADRNNFRMEVWGGTNTSTANLSNNSVLAQAQGVVATNAATLNVGTLDSTSGENDAAVANLQNVDGADILATARGAGEPVVLTEIGGDVVSSSVDTSANRIVATAESARATNSLTVNATVIDAGGLDNGSSDGYPSLYNNVDAGFAVANTQLGGAGNVTASLRDAAGGAFDNSSAVLTDIGDEVTSSSVTSSDNVMQALASSNKATNTLAVDATSLSLATSGVGNVQVSEQDVAAQIGFAGTDPIPGFSVTGIAGGGVWTANILSLTAAQKAAFIALYGTTPGWTYNAGTGAVSFTQVGSGSLTLPVTGSSGSYNSGGVLVTVGGDISASSVAVEGNVVQGSAIGNSATNRATVTATSLTSLENYGSAAAWTDETGDPEASADADTTLASAQVLVSGSSSTTDAFATFGIDAGTDNPIADSQLSVSGNSLYGEAIGNTVTNSLTVSATDQTAASASGALSNSQDGLFASISASTDMEVVSNTVSSTSDIAMDRNANTALAVVNAATNTVTASSTNSGSTVQADVDSWVDDGDSGVANGSFVLVNAQNSGGTLGSTATTSVYNVSAVDTSTTGVVDGTVSQSLNATRAESTANRSTNTLTLNADANLGSTGGLVNQQNSSTTVDADASSTVSLTVNGTGPATEAVDGSSIVTEGNSAVALARGNSASNTLNYTAGATYTAEATRAFANPTFAEADAALLNDQLNSGDVTATATGTTMVALNTVNGVATSSVLNGSVSNSNNTVAAYAYGNSASNAVMLSALNTGTPNVALGNQQLNTGAVTATATSVTFAISSVGTVGASSMMNNGNVASATAVGNSAVSFIGAQ